MATVVETILKLRGSRQFQREADESSKSIKRIGDASEDAEKRSTAAFRRVASASGSLVAAAGIGSIVKSSISAARDLNEEVNKSSVIFGASSRQIQEWSRSAASGFGISQREALSAAGNFGGFFKVAGKSGPEVAKLSQQMVELGGDMASFNNTTPEDALNALRSGLSGEVEPLRRYRVFLSDAALKQEALSQGISPVNGQFTDQQKVMLRMGIILKQTKDAQGDYARTSGSLANQQKTLQAQWENSRAELGNNLLPLMNKLVGILNALAGNSVALYGGLGLLTAAFALNAAATLAASAAQFGFSMAMVRTRLATLLATAAMAGLNLSMLLIPLAIALIVGGLVLLYMKCDWFRNAVQAAMHGVVAAFGWVKQAAVDAFNWIKTNWPLLVAIITGPIGLAVYAIVKNFDKIKAAIADVKNAISSLPSKGLGVLKAVVPGVQTGGTILRGGAALVGERGPELVNLPTGAHVFNAHETAAFARSPSLEPAANQVIQLVVDKRVLAEVTASAVADKQARR